MSLRESPLRDSHVALGARLTEFGGWAMPVKFDSIRDEHTAVREAAGKFDVSHMGEIVVSGRDAETLMNRLTTNDVSVLDPGDSQYAMITDPDGIILDDTVIYRFGSDEFLFVPNAGHDGEMYERWCRFRDDWELDASIENQTEAYGMIAVQGPDAAELVASETDEHIGELLRFEVMAAMVDGIQCWVARTGYTGEDGFELMVPWDETAKVWDVFDCQPCGLGARDTLRTEMGYLLSGQDFHPIENPRNPFEAGVSFTVKLGNEFVGRDELERVSAEGVEERLVGLVLIDRGVPRPGYPITDPGGDRVGVVTSGTMSPTLNEAIALGYVPVEYREPGTPVRVVIRDESKKAKIRATPFLPGK